MGTAALVPVVNRRSGDFFNHSSVLRLLIEGQNLSNQHAAWVVRRLAKESNERSRNKQLLGACLPTTPPDADTDNLVWRHRPQLGPAASSSGMLSHQAGRNQSDEEFAITFFDDRARPNVRAIIELAEVIRWSSRSSRVGISFYALLKHMLSIKGVRTIAMSDMGRRVRCVQQGLERFVSFAGRSMAGVLHKVLIHWIMPLEVKRIVLLDGDLIPLRSLADLQDEFAAMQQSGALFGLVPEQSEFYGAGLNMPPGVPGYNTGVWLMDLHAMRASSWYSWILDAYQAGALFRHLGMVPDQNFANGVAGLSPGLFHTMDCSWNRQLGSWTLSAHKVLRPSGFPPRQAANVLGCDGQCGMLHFNGNEQTSIKCLVKPLLAARGSCQVWHRAVREISSSSEGWIQNKSECNIRRMFGGRETLRARQQIEDAVFRLFGGCCRNSSA